MDVWLHHRCNKAGRKTATYLNKILVPSAHRGVKWCILAPIKERCVGPRFQEQFHGLHVTSENGVMKCSSSKTVQGIYIYKGKRRRTETLWGIGRSIWLAINPSKSQIRLTNQIPKQVFKVGYQDFFVLLIQGLGLN